MVPRRKLYMMVAKPIDNNERAKRERVRMESREQKGMKP
jgi:hypothetical protein